MEDIKNDLKIIISYSKLPEEESTKSSKGIIKTIILYDTANISDEELTQYLIQATSEMEKNGTLKNGIYACYRETIKDGIVTQIGKEISTKISGLPEKEQEEYDEEVQEIIDSIKPLPVIEQPTRGRRFSSQGFYIDDKE